MDPEELEARLKDIEAKLDPPPPAPDPRAPRHVAATILAGLFSLSFLMLIFAEMISTVHHGLQTGDTLTTLMLTTGSLLVGVTGSYLSRNINRPPTERPELESRVGIILAATLGGMLLIMAIADVYEAVAGSPTVGLSTNALNVFAVLLSGIIGALGGYLGFGRPKDNGPTDVPPKSPGIE